MDISTSPLGKQDRYSYNDGNLRQSVTTGTATQHMTWTSSGLPLLLDDDQHAYIYGAAGEPISQIDTTNNAEYLHQDALGSTRLITSAAGATIGTATYTAYGQPTTTGTVSRLGYAAQYTDPESGLQYLRARYYDRATGQFLTRDPIEDVTGDPYGYAGGNPVMNTDPTGLLSMGNYEVGFNPGAGLNAIVNIGRGANGGLTDDVANAISPGASCTVDQNRLQQGIGLAAALVVTSGGATAGELAGRGGVGFAKQSRRSGKERASDIPTVARQDPPSPDENKADYLRRLFGDNPATGSNSPYSQTGKWYDRHWNKG